MDISKLRIFIDSETSVEFPNDAHVKCIKSGNIIEELVKGNFISTQSIFVKKIIITRYMFDETLPRLQDYDLVLRMVPNIKVSYTDNCLSESYRSPDSISNDLNKLRKAVICMIKKDYHISEKNRERFCNSLINTYNEHYSHPIIIENNEIKRYVDSLYKDYKKLESDYNHLKQEKKQIDKSYNDIINSKRWKVINKLFNFWK